MFATVAHFDRKGGFENGGRARKEEGVAPQILIQDITPNSFSFSKNTAIIFFSINNKFLTKSIQNS
jgi:hypothetical protein